MLDGVHQGHRQVARAMQDGEAKRGYQHHVARRGRTVFPQQDGPGEQPGSQPGGDGGMEQAQLLKVAQRAAARGHLLLHPVAEALPLPHRGAERPHQRHVVDHVHQLAIHGGRVGGVLMVQRAAACCQPAQRKGQHGGHGNQRGGHHRAHRDHHRNRPGDREQRRQHVPCKGILNRVDGVAGGGDAAGQGAWRPVREVAWGVAGQVLEQIAPQVAGDCNKAVRGHPTAHTP